MLRGRILTVARWGWGERYTAKGEGWGDRKGRPYGICGRCIRLLRWFVVEIWVGFHRCFVGLLVGFFLGIGFRYPQSSQCPQVGLLRKWHFGSAQCPIRSTTVWGGHVDWGGHVGPPVRGRCRCLLVWRGGRGF